MTSAFSIEQLIALNDEIVSLVREGVPLELGLSELGGDSAGALQDISQSLAARMNSGASLAEAVQAEQKRLPVTYRTVVEAGIRAGRLPAALVALSNYARELVDLRRRITLALLYPFIVVVLAYLLFGVFIVQMVRRFRETYELFRLPLHWSLEMLSQVTEWVTQWWWVPPLCLVVAVIWWVATGGARLLTFSGPARPLALFPYVGRIGRYFQYANFAELLVLMVEHQVPLPEGLRLTAQATGDARLRRAGLELAQSIENGEAVGGSSHRRFGFPPFLFWVLTCGQTAAGLAKLLRHAASIYRRQGVNLSHWLRIVFPIVAAAVIGGGVTLLYTLSLFGPLAQLWNDLDSIDRLTKMMNYAYIAIDSRGQRVSGELEASDPDEVVSQLTAQGLRIESVHVAPPGAASSEAARPEKLSPVETREVGRHISEIVSAGLPLEAGLAAIAEEFPGGRVQRELRGIVRDLEAGNDLESVLAARRTPGYLPALVRAGVRSGRTGEILENFISGTQVVSDLHQTFWLALAYPLILLVVLFSVSVFLLLVVVPQFGTIFEGWGLQLPGLTVAVLTLSEFLVEHGGWALAIGTGAMIATIVSLRLILGKVAVRRFICTVPIVGPLVRSAALARFAPVLSLLIEGRIPLDEALVLSGDASGDAAIREDCRTLAASIRSGNTLEAAASETKRFPTSFIRALSWERHRDGFPEVLRSMADMYAARARAITALLVAVMPGLVMLFVSLSVGLVIYALFRPLIELLNKLA